MNRSWDRFPVLLVIAIAGLLAPGCEAPPEKSDKNAPVPVGGLEDPIDNLKKYPNELSSPSIVQMLAHRDKYHGKKVQIGGYLRVRFEDTAIYLSKQDAEYHISTNGFWVTFDKTALPYVGNVGPTEFDNKYVIIEGMFNKDKMGHYSAWQGSIEKIDRIIKLKATE